MTVAVVIEARLAPRRRPLTPAQIARVRAMQDRIDREVRESLARGRSHDGGSAGAPAEPSP